MLDPSPRPFFPTLLSFFATGLLLFVAVSQSSGCTSYTRSDKMIPAPAGDHPGARWLSGPGALSRIDAR